MKRVFAILMVSLFLFTSSIFATSNESFINKKDAPVQFFAEYESGFISILSHTIQIGSNGTLFNYVTQGGQDILFPFERVNVGAVINDRHRISLLYQPFEINTVVPFEENVTVDGKEFVASSEGLPMELKYGFPFWRISYSYDLMEQKDLTIGIGFALQIRNASIIFKAVDGSNVSVSQNTGLVPALHFYSMWETPIGLNLSADITGSYASSAFFNGADFEFEGSLLDASIRTGYRLKNNIEIFGNFRIFGGTSKGKSSYSGSNWSVSSNDDRFSQNNIWTFSSTIGCTIR